MGWSLVYLTLGMVLTSLGYQLVGTATAGSMPGLTTGVVGPALLQAVVGIGVFAPLTWLIGRKALELSRSELGWAEVRLGVRGFGKGFVVAMAVGALSLAPGLLFRSSWRLDGAPLGQYLATVPLLTLILLPAAFFEELAFRGVLVRGLVRGVGRAGALVMSSVLFAAAHRANPEVTGLALANIALAGVFLGLTFLAQGGLWTATGAHLGWNLSLAALAAPVSGLPFAVPWIDFSPGAPAWLTGGGFGPEGGILASIALGVGSWWVTRWRDFREGA